MVAFLSTATRSRRRGAASGASTAVGSCGSAPAIAARTSSASRALRVSGPSLSSVQHSAIAPWRDTRPYVGRKPVTPHAVAGNRIEPDVSDPIAKPTSPAAAAIPEPLDEPPLQNFAFHGVRPGPVNDASASP